MDNERPTPRASSVLLGISDLRTAETNAELWQIVCADAERLGILKEFRRSADNTIGPLEPSEGRPDPNLVLRLEALIKAIEFLREEQLEEEEEEA